ncbi:MAG: S-layer homology domain-containing protein [Acidimicrobiia bacterium]
MRHRNVPWLMAVAVGLIISSSVPALPALAANCDNAYVAGQVPLTDLGSSTYQGETGGLYPGGSNVAPDAHAALGSQLASQIVPLATDGSPNAGGKIGFISVGVSNTVAEFEAFLTRDETAIDPAVVRVNGAQGGADVFAWMDSGAPTWSEVDSRLSEAGLSPQQVQVAWVKLPEAGPNEPFPLDASTYASTLAQVMRSLKVNYPNIKIAYISSRIYGGYGGLLNPEPFAYQHGFGVKWTIEAQIEGDPNLNPDPGKGPVVSPWLGWGPYLWANGAGPDEQPGGSPGRSDGLEWLCEDFKTDGIHPVGSGSAKVADMLIAHLNSDPTACLWYLADPSSCGAVVPPIPAGVFVDIAGSGFEEDIIWLAAQGITNGCSPAPNPMFCPNASVTRGQMAAFLNRALSLAPGPDAFSDDEGSIFEADINAVAHAGITVGCTPTAFCPNDLITRGQMAAFLDRALDLPDGPDVFSDDNGSIFEVNINALARSGITFGCSATNFCPNAAVTRGQMAAFLHRAESWLE